MRFHCLALLCAASLVVCFGCSDGGDGGEQVAPRTAPGNDVPCFPDEGTVVLEVSGVPITDATVDRLTGVHRARNPGLSTMAAKRFALEDAIIQAAVYGQYRENVPAASKRAWELHARLVGGENFAALAKAESHCPTKARSGRLGGDATTDRPIGRSLPGAPSGIATVIEDVLFSTEPGKFTEPFASFLGLHILLVREEIPGAEARLDTRKASHILVAWDQADYDSGDLMKAAKKHKDTARVEIRDKAYKKLLPKFRWNSEGQEPSKGQ